MKKDISTPMIAAIIVVVIILVIGIGWYAINRDTAPINATYNPASGVMPRPGKGGPMSSRAATGTTRNVLMPSKP